MNMHRVDRAERISASRENVRRARAHRSSAIAKCAAAIATAAVVASGAAFAAPEAPEIPTGLVVGLEDPIRLEDRMYRVTAEAERSFDLERRPVVDLAIDVLAQYFDVESSRPRPGSFVPHLDGTYRLRSGNAVLAEGDLEFRLSSRGPAYGADVRLTEPPADLDLEIALTPRPGSRDNGAPFAFGAAFAESDVRDKPREVGVDAPADDIRMNVLGTLDPRPSASYSDVWGYTDGVTYLAMVGYTTGTVFIDVTDPANPFEVGDITGPSSSWRDVKTYSTYAYISTEGTGTGQGIQVVDLSDPSNPTLVNTYTQIQTCHNVVMDESIGELWAVGTDNATRILDVATDPVNPVEIGSFDPRYVHDAQVDQGHVCLSEINNGRQEIADSSNPSNIQVLSGWSTPDTAAHNCWMNQAQTLMVTTDETGGGHAALYDITDKNQPGILLAEYEPDPSAIVHNAYFDDDDNERITMAHYALGFKMIDSHRPSAPVELASYDTYPSGETGFNGAWGAYSFDPRGYHYVSDISTGLYVLEYAPTGGVLSGVVRDFMTLDPVPDATIVALPGGVPAVSASDGVYAVYAPAGDTQLRVSAWGFRSAVIDAGSMPLDGRLDIDVELQRLPRFALAGTVTRSDNGLPIEGVDVSIVGSGLTVQTDANGDYTFAEAAIGQQIVTAQAFGFSSVEGRLVIDNGAATLDFSLDPAQFVDDAEGNLGWDLGVAGDNAVSGEWTRVDPNGTGGGNVQPENDNTPNPGVTAFITGQSNPGAGTEANDVEGGVTTLLSPIVDASGLGAAQLRYYRWSSNSSGILGGGSLRVQASIDGGANWSTLENVGNANSWNRRIFDLGSTVGLTDQMRIRFRAEASTGFDNFRALECGVDDFEIVRACVARFNLDAGDADGDGNVDACDACSLDGGNDLDGDGVCGNVDNAPLVANADQTDSDGDGIGDAADNCVSDANVLQLDTDDDGLGNACDADMDGDGDDNGIDGDDDGDGIADASDLCPAAPNAGQLDDDSDGVGNACDTDDGLVQGLRVDGDHVSWVAEDGSDDYNLYRGDMGAAGLVGLAACRVTGIPSTEAFDADLPVPGDGYFYLVTRVAGGIEGPLGRDAAGIERAIDTRCP